MKTVNFLKNTLPVVASIGAGAVVGTVLKTFTPIDGSTISKVSFSVGAIVMTSMVGDMAANYTEGYIDGTVDKIEKIKEALADATEN